METLRFEKVTCVTIRIGKKKIFLLLERSTTGELQIVIFLTSQFSLSGAS